MITRTMKLQEGPTLAFLYSIVALHLPEISPMSVFPRRIRPEIALYVPEKYPL